MSQYRRLISYIYAYEGGVKGKNIGYAKIEVRNGQCRIQVSVKKIYVGSSEIGVYLLTSGTELLLGRIFVRNGAGEYRTQVDAENIEGSGCGMDQCYGLTIHDVESTWRSYTTIWEDAVAQAAEIELADVTAENARKKEREEEKTARARRSEEAGAKGEEIALRPMRLAVSEEIQKELEWEERRLEATAPWDKEADSAEGAQPSAQDKGTADKAETAPAAPLSGQQSTGGREELQPEVALRFEPQKEPEEPVAEPKGPEPEEPVAEPKGPEPEKPVAEPKGPEPKEPVAEPKGPEPEKPVAEPKGPEPQQQSERKLPPGPQVCLADDSLDSSASSSAAALRGQGNPLWSRLEALQARLFPEMHPKMPLKPMADAPEAVPAATADPRIGAPQAAVKSQTFENTQADPALGKQHSQQLEDTAGQTSSSSFSQGPENPSVLRELDRQEEEGTASDRLWKRLSGMYTKVLAFDYDHGSEILSIKPQDIGLLSREIWIYGNNSFLLHGYYNYRHLILARLECPQGPSRYLLGVPGHYFRNEKYMASMFGFPHFVLAKKQPEEDGRFGYWYTDIRL